MTAIQPEHVQHGVCLLCERPRHSRGWCNAHYKQWLKYGDPLGRPRLPLEERFWSCVDKASQDDCWLWTGSLNRKGYGRFGQTARAHRVAYELLVGPIPAGLTLDHLCHNRDMACAGGVDCRHRRCVRPDHLEPATRAVNTMRGRTWSAENAAKTHCPKGHPYDQANTRIGVKGDRQCRACGREGARLRRRNRRMA